MRQSPATDELIDILQKGGYSCVVRNGETRTFTGRGVTDLYGLLKNEPDFLNGASVADKVVGRAAAALLIMGKAAWVYAGRISEPALDLLRRAGVETGFGQVVPYIRNRDDTGICPLEAICREKPPGEILPAIEEFFTKINKA